MVWSLKSMLLIPAYLILIGIVIIYFFIFFSARALAPIKADAVEKKIVFSDPVLYETKGTHYHHTLNKGETTLPNRLGQELVSHLAQNKTFDVPAYVKQYVSMLTTPKHNDVFVGGLHRTFVKNVMAGKPLEECPMGGAFAGGGDIVTALPLMLYFHKDLDKAKQFVKQRTMLSYKSEQAVTQNHVFTELFYNIFKGNDPLEAICYAFSQVTPDTTLDLKKIIQEPENTHDLFMKYFAIS